MKNNNQGEHIEGHLSAKQRIIHSFHVRFEKFEEHPVIEIFSLILAAIVFYTVYEDLHEVHWQTLSDDSCRNLLAIARGNIGFIAKVLDGVKNMVLELVKFTMKLIRHTK